MRAQGTANYNAQTEGLVTCERHIQDEDIGEQTDVTFVVKKSKTICDSAGYVVFLSLPQI